MVKPRQRLLDGMPCKSAGIFKKASMYMLWSFPAKVGMDSRRISRSGTVRTHQSKPPRIGGMHMIQRGRYDHHTRTNRVC